MWLRQAIYGACTVDAAGIASRSGAAGNIGESEIATGASTTETLARTRAGPGRRIEEQLLFRRLSTRQSLCRCFV